MPVQKFFDCHFVYRVISGPFYNVLNFHVFFYSCTQANAILFNEIKLSLNDSKVEIQIQAILWTQSIIIDRKEL